MSTQATVSVRVIGGNVDKALRALKNRLAKEGIWGYDPNARRNPKKKLKIKDTKNV